MNFRHSFYKNINIAFVVHGSLFVFGVLRIITFHSIMSWKIFWELFPSTGGLVAAYLWIRPDLWFSTKDTSQSDWRNRVSRQAECFITIVLLLTIAEVQFRALETFDKQNIFIISLSLLAPIGSVSSRSVEKILKRWHKITD